MDEVRRLRRTDMTRRAHTSRNPRAAALAGDRVSDPARRRIAPKSAAWKFFSAKVARNPLISPESRKFFATFGNAWKFLEGALEIN